MKKSFTILVLFLFICFELKAQKEVLFKLKILPNSTYSSIMKMDINMEMNMAGDTTFINQAKKNGITSPIVMQMQSGFNSTIKTGAVNVQKDVPFTMNMQSQQTKMKMNGKESIIPIPATNQIFYGVYTDGSKVKIDSVGGKKLDESLKASIVKMIEGIQANIKFPEKPMKIGDTFLQDVPMDMPIAGFSAKLISKTTYKLTSIENNKAYFDLNYIIIMDMSGQNMSLNMSGDGNGKFTYDIAANYPVNMINNMNMIYSMVMPQSDKVKMNGKVKMIMDSQTNITTLK